MPSARRKVQVRKFCYFLPTTRIPGQSKEFGKRENSSESSERGIKTVYSGTLQKYYVEMFNFDPKKIGELYSLFDQMDVAYASLDAIFMLEVRGKYKLRGIKERFRVVSKMVANC